MTKDGQEPPRERESRPDAGREREREIEIEMEREERREWGGREEGRRGP